MSKPSFRTPSLLLSCCTALLWATSGIAQEPSCALDCLKGFACQIQTGACPELPRGECEPTPTPTCVAIECSSDADCAEHLTCYDGDTSADMPPQCAPKHFLACNADADCGTGFTCAPLNPCFDPAEPDCVPEGEKVCFITEGRACQADSDCLPDWTCENNPLNAYWANTAGETGCNIVDPALICMPPHASVFGIGAAGYLDWAKGIEWTHTSVPVSECPEPTSPHVPYGTPGIPQSVQESRPGVSDPVMATDTSGDSTLPLPSSSAAPAPRAASSGGCSISSAGIADAHHAGNACGVASVLALAGMVWGRRRARTSRR